ncbi:MAG TPA: prepilin-type N-terminal cleavage/methylation domain-containing protein [Eubacteriaceae bacterium]|jgi:prepilin-type N-terminal cleavage/methylation domain-containing protein|nr:prepilin-type N-terminal cleavage/methylation domain-containing protein [Eubacteriaceae bacterium]
MYPKYISHKRFLASEGGVTLVELIIVLALIGIVLTVAGSMFVVGISSFNTADEQVESYSSGRMAFLNIERQIKRSEEIYIKDNVVYIQDIESPLYYNYYTLEGSQIKKFKVDKDSLEHLPSGYKSQFAENILDFQLKKVDSEDILQLRIEAVKEGKKIELSSHIRVGVGIINK